MRVLRIAWALLTNGMLIYLFYGGAEQVAALNRLLEQNSQNRAVWAYFALRSSIPTVAILLTLFGSRFAKWTNVGLFAYFGLAFLLTGIWNWSDYHARPYLLLGPLALIISGVTFLLYRKPARTRAEPSV